MKIFVLGLPGCGKSTAVHHIRSVAAKEGFTVRSYNDYTILREWFEQQPDGPAFSRADNDGFDIHDLTVFDTSLKELEQRILREVTSDKEFIIVEFARNDYVHALEQFSPSFLENSCFLFIRAENTTCKKRTRKRAIHRTSSDDHFVSDYIFDTYYFKSINDHVSSVSLFIEALLSEVNPLLSRATLKKRVMVIDNTKRISKEDFYLEVEQRFWQVVERPDLIHYKSKKDMPDKHKLSSRYKRVKHDRKNILYLVKD